ncbi:TonB family protein [Yoonia sp.]|uniref:energy transducer TonB family protein n=1 Tax=Yoonia sp. TaxID=2212373 RepID=UPI003F7132F0
MTRLRACGGAIAALALSGALHAAGLLVVAAPPQRIAVAGGGTPDIAAIGAAFEDFVAGVVPVTPAAQPAVAPAPAQRSLALPASAVADLAVPDLAVSVTPDPSTSAPVATGATPVTARETTPQAAPDATSALPDTAPATSLRPIARPAPQTAQPAAPPRPTGNAETDAARGSTQAQPQGQATAAGAAAAPDSTGGQAAAAAYPGQVLRQITRLRPQRAPARGIVLVRFAISASGALADVSVAQSSGSAALDRLALDHIRRAAPFAAPPAGAQMAFSFEFLGRP